MFWSRVYGGGLEARALTARASYSAALPLMRATMEWLGAEQAVVGRSRSSSRTGCGRRGRPMPSSTRRRLAWAVHGGSADRDGARDGRCLRAVSELSRPHFGASALLTADGSHDKRFLVNWADEAFHLGWAQLLFGWQIVIQDRQCRFAVGSGLFGVESEDRQEYQRLHRQSQTILEDQRRCRGEWILDQGRQRLLIDNFRRQPSARRSGFCSRFTALSPAWRVSRGRGVLGLLGSSGGLWDPLAAVFL